MRVCLLLSDSDQRSRRLFGAANRSVLLLKKCSMQAVVSSFLKRIAIVVLVAGFIRDTEFGRFWPACCVLKDLFFTSCASIDIRNFHPKASEALTLSLHKIFQISVREVFKSTHLDLVIVIFNSHFEVSSYAFPLWSSANTDYWSTEQRQTEWRGRWQK